MLVISDGRQQMRARHRDLDGLRGECRYSPELAGKAEVNRVADRPPADGGRVKHIRIVLADRLWSGLALKSRYLLPEMIEHRVWRGMAIVGAPVHLAPGDHVDARDLLLQYCRL